MSLRYNAQKSREAAVALASGSTAEDQLKAALEHLLLIEDSELDENDRSSLLIAKNQSAALQDRIQAVIRLALDTQFCLGLDHGRQAKP